MRCRLTCLCICYPSTASFLFQMSYKDIQCFYSEYAVDHAHSLRIKEKERITFNFQSPQLEYRSHLINWIRRIGEDEKFSATTVHLAIYLLDIFMDGHQITPERLNLVTIVCLSLAAKMEELECKVPKISDLNGLFKNKYSYMASDFICLEVMVVRFVDWNLIHPTAAHFAEYFVAFATTSSDFKNAVRFDSYKQLKHFTLQYIRDFLDKSLMDLQMHRFPPSIVAASCIAAARHILRLAPAWTLKLAALTEYQLCDLQPCIRVLTGETHNKRKRKITESPDHGYETGSTYSSPEQLAPRKCKRSSRSSVR